MANSTLKKPSASKTTVALKVLMAVTGLLFILFLLVHMYGNLKMFMGQEAYNHYAHWLQGTVHVREDGSMDTILYPLIPAGGVVWIMRIGLLLFIVLHMYSAIVLWKRGSDARGRERYKVNVGAKVRAGRTYQAMVMRFGGLVIAVWIVFHILQFTALKVTPGDREYIAGDPYSNMVSAFNVWWVWAFYLIALIAIALHVRHGIFSALATLGLLTRTREFGFKLAGDLVAILLVVGFMAPPTAILFGFIGYPA